MENDTMTNRQTVTRSESALEWKNIREYNRMNRKKQNKTCLKILLEEINQKILAKEGRLKRYRNKCKQYKQYKFF